MGEVMEVEEGEGQCMEKGVEAAMQELLLALSPNTIRVREAVCVFTFRHTDAGVLCYRCVFVCVCVLFNFQAGRQLRFPEELHL